MSHFVNESASMVTASLDGLIRGSGGRLARLDGYPDIKVVMQREPSSEAVAVISGGGAGHEPSHAGFVGHGLLTAAVSGEIFASPSTEAVVAAMAATRSTAGCLLIVKNYTGDRLNFGLAAERARATGHRVDMVIVADDVALPEFSQPRGLAGTLFVHKVAGAASAAGRTLPEVAHLARRAASAVRTIGVSASGVDIPFRAWSRRFADDTVELGLGIHGEPGREEQPLGAARDLVGRMVRELAEHLPRSGPLAFLVNNLGGVSSLEMNIIVNDLLDTDLGSRAELLVGPLPAMTSLSMRGFSLSALPLDGELRSALVAPAEPATAWPGARTAGPLTTVPTPVSGSTTVTEPSDDPMVRSLIVATCAGLESAQERLDALDAQIGDGDTGSTFAAAARRVLEHLDTLSLAEPAVLCAQLSQVVSSSMGGSSGVLLSIMFAATGAALDRAASIGEALQAGVAAIENYGGAARGDRTMLDALVPAVETLSNGGSLGDVARAAVAGADGTADLPIARAGRASYVRAELLRGVADPGAVAVAVALTAMAGATDR
jgi:dihydroxyacetone kinase